MRLKHNIHEGVNLYAERSKSVDRKTVRKKQQKVKINKKNTAEGYIQMGQHNISI